MWIIRQLGSLKKLENFFDNIRLVKVGFTRILLENQKLGNINQNINQKINERYEKTGRLL